MPALTLTAYLAGPFNSCNEKQIHEWRRDVRSQLRKHGYKWIDPADHKTAWSPLMEMIDIEKCEVVIANLWKESIGTVVGIVQAARLGKPIILIDPNYIDSRIVCELVGAENVVRSVEAAINKLVDHIAPNLQLAIEVEKKNGACEPFRVSKLQRSINAVCADLEINDAVLPVLVSRRVQSCLRSKSGRVAATEIATLVLEELNRLSIGDLLYESSLESHAARLSEEWRRQRNVKDDRRVLEELEKATDDLQERNVALRGQLEGLIQENSILRTRLESAQGVEVEHTFKSVAEAVKAATDRFVESLVFTKRAFESASDCPFTRPDEAYDVLRCLSEYATEVRSAANAGSARPKGLKEWLRARGSAVEYAAGESESTRQDRDAQVDRTVLYLDKKVVMSKHLKIGAGSPNHCFRLYFEPLGNESDRNYLIGLIGRHP